MILRPILLALLLFATPTMAQEAFDTIDPTDDNMQTGPAVGEKIPAFRAVDQNGQAWDFDSIKGPKGALLLFYRSADW